MAWSYPLNQGARPVASVDVAIHDLHVVYEPQQSSWERLNTFLPKSVRAKQFATMKPILNGICASMPAGSLTAIMGSSGSGKTTLLNTIAHRITSTKLKVSGNVTYNGSPKLSSIRSSYVMQQDVLEECLTVRETLQYAADLRLCSPSTKQERMEIVEANILELGLKECAETRIGSYMHKGCSGGEKRRTSIAVQMLANPSVLFCDEPTTGLDAYSAFQVVQTLKSLAQRGRTVIISIHSPRSEIWSLFDRVILLSGGTVLLSGEVEAAMSYLSQSGIAIPSYTNPAEFLIDLAAVDLRSEAAEKASSRRVEALKQTWLEQSSEILPSYISPSPVVPFVHTAPSMSKPEKVGFMRQLRVLTHRGTKVTLRDPSGVVGSLFEAVAVSTISGWIFYRLEGDLSGIRSREGALYVILGVQTYLISFIEIFRLNKDIQVFDRERSENAVDVLPFMFSRRLSRLFLEDIPVPFIFSSIFYFMCNFRSDAPTFFIFLTINVIAQYASVCFAAVCVALSRDLTQASLIANLGYTVQSFSCGIFIQPDQIAIWLRWLKWTCFIFYAFGALIYNEFVGVAGGSLGQVYACPDPDPTSPQCAQYTGRFIVASLGFPSNWLWKPIVAETAFVIGFFVAAAMILAFWKIDIDLAGVKKTKGDDFRSTTANSLSIQDVRPVEIGLRGYGLRVQRKHMLRGQTTKIILQPINAVFEAGKINVIMGPSGSGKTSLLQSLARRMPDNMFSSYQCSGDITINGTVPGPDVLNSITSLVTQDDETLIPSLTVRETLYFAAGLRLPSWMSKEEKDQRAEDVILKMGLKDCADRFVGSEMKKGISGGEKRRVSIAVQILTDPRVLLLDEPTSGLDAFLASSVFDVLKTLADEGRTIIMTMHQARSDLFKVFDNVLLLTRGGSVAYSGPGNDMLSHFQARLGFVCAPNTNPSDFALDLITVDLQQHDREIESREKVERIVADWTQLQKLPAEIIPAHDVLATPADLNNLKRQMNPFHTTFPLVLQRSALTIRRDPNIMLARIMQVLGIGIVMLLWFTPLQSNYEAIQSRMGLIQEFCALYFVGMLQNLAVYPASLSIFTREKADHCYTAHTFLLSYTILELPFTLISSLLASLLISFAIGLSRTAAGYFSSALFIFSVVTCGESIGIIFCTLLPSQHGFAVNIMSIAFGVASNMAGVLSTSLPPVLAAVNWTNPARYGVRAVAGYAMRGVVFTCTEGQKVGGQCPVSSGEDVLRLYRLDGEGGPGLMLVGLAGCAVVYRILAWAIVWGVFRK